MAQATRKQFWAYCKRVAGQSRHRAKRDGVPHDIDAHDIDRLLVDQKYRCAISGIDLELKHDVFGARGPFAPSLDRIVPTLCYTKGNLRIVCQMVNLAMNSWGLDALKQLMIAMIKADDDLMLFVVNEVARDLEALGRIKPDPLPSERLRGGGM